MTNLGFVFDLAVWDNPSANDLIDSLLNQRSADSLRESVDTPTTQGRGINEPVAVIGSGLSIFREAGTAIGLS